MSGRHVASATATATPGPDPDPDATEVRAIATFPTGPSRALWRLRLVSYTLLVLGLVCSLRDQPGLVTGLALAAAVWLAFRRRASSGHAEPGTLVLHDDASLAWFDDAGVRGGPLEPTASVGLGGVLFLLGQQAGSPAWLCLSQADARPEDWLALRRWLLWRQRGGRPVKAGLDSTTSALS